MSTIPLALAKEQLELTHSSQDTMLQAILDGLDTWLEKELEIYVTKASRIEYLDGGVQTLFTGNRPLVSVTELCDLYAPTTTMYYRVVEDQILLTGSDGDPVDARFFEGTRRFKLTSIGGYDGADNVPADIKLAMLTLLTRRYYNRGGALVTTQGGIFTSWSSLANNDINHILNRYRRMGGVL